MAIAVVDQIRTQCNALLVLKDRRQLFSVQRDQRKWGESGRASGFAAKDVWGP